VTWAVIVLAIIAVAAGLLFKGYAKNLEINKPWPYKQKNLMSETERKMFLRLKGAHSEKVVFAQVSMSQVLSYPRRWHNRVAQKSLDFVVCNEDGSIYYAAELDDKSHVGRNKPDQTKEKALEAAGITLIRWHVAKMPSIAEIRETVKKRLTDHQTTS
jgi:very-short-patch-repair endonuclease